MNKPPNVLHIVAGTLDGGAAKGAHSLHRALLTLGVRSKILSNTPATDADVISIASTSAQQTLCRVRAFLDASPAFLYRNRHRRIFSTGLFGAPLKRHPAVRQADIVHIHWAAGLLRLRDLRHLQRPIVWTVRDMWPFTGGCHYSAHCSQHTTGCGLCPQLNSSTFRDISYYGARLKKRAIPTNTLLVGISDWITTGLRQSFVTRHLQSITIHNAISTEVFTPTDKQQARQALTIPNDRPVIAYGAKNLNDFYKGRDLFFKALPLLQTKPFFLFFGRNALTEPFPHPHLNIGDVTETHKLRLVYSAADAFVCTSTQEAFGKTLAEAMACETPVVCFNACGPKEIVSHYTTGYKATPFDTADLARGIDWIASLPAKQKTEINHRCRIDMCQRFSTKTAADKYLRVYSQLLAGQR